MRSSKFTSLVYQKDNWAKLVWFSTQQYKMCFLRNNREKFSCFEILYFIWYYAMFIKKLQVVSNKRKKIIILLYVLFKRNKLVQYPFNVRMLHVIIVHNLWSDHRNLVLFVHYCHNTTCHYTTSYTFIEATRISNRFKEFYSILQDNLPSISI